MFSLTFRLENDSFQPTPQDQRNQIAQILSKVRDQVQNQITDAPIRDENGNTIGRFTISPNQE